MTTSGKKILIEMKGKELKRKIQEEMKRMKEREIKQNGAYQKEERNFYV